MLDLPQRNAILTAIAGGGTTEDYDSPAGADDPKWEGEADAWVHDSARAGSDLGGGFNLVKTTWVVIPGELAPFVAMGDSVSLERDGVASTREVRETTGPYNPTGWPYSTMRVWLAPE